MRKLYTFNDFGMLLKKVGIMSDDLRTWMVTNQENLKRYPFAKDKLYGSIEEGSLIDKTIELAQLSVFLNETLYGGQENNEDLIAACLLSQISKVNLFERSTEDWEIKRGIFWKFKNDTNGGGLRTGEKSYLILKNLNLNINDNVYRGIVAMDKEIDDSMINLHGTLIETIIRQAHSMLLTRHRFELNNAIITNFTFE